MKNVTNEFSFVLKLSSIPDGGIGIYAIHNISAGTKLALMPEGGEARTMDVNDVPEQLKHFIIELGDGKCRAPKEFNHLWIVWYINHSKKPNVTLRKDDNNYYAIRDIVAGEELFTDYNSFDEPSELKDDYYK
ncbi:MAG: SET domain-containing protein [Parcubacteria group bacterium]|nr:SET domain-containing protein [Parcubacteria group bacterium]